MFWGQLLIMLMYIDWYGEYIWLSVEELNKIINESLL